jgi:peptidoglycan/LPS O-acetylase OafA/YrhL
MIKPLTSLRFVFALMVFLSHLQFVQDKTFAGLYMNYFREGRLGVSFFFILSGFVLALTYKKKIVTGTFSKKEFWMARLARIYPLHIVTFLIAIPVSMIDLYGGFATAAARALSNLSLLQSFIPSQDWYFTFNKLSWSISDEQFFYLLFPFAMLFLYKHPGFKKYSPLLLLLVPVGIYFCPEKFQQYFFYVTPVTRFADFYIGILLYEIFESNRFAKYFQLAKTVTVIEIVSILLFVIFFFYYKNIPDADRFSFYYWLPMTFIIFSFSYNIGWVSKILSNKLLVYLGEISFGFYLIQQLVIRYFLIINEKYSLLKNDWWVITTIFIITLIGSHLSYMLIEQPCRRIIRKKLVQKNTNGR